MMSGSGSGSMRRSPRLTPRHASISSSTQPRSAALKVQSVCADTGETMARAAAIAAVTITACIPLTAARQALGVPLALTPGRDVQNVVLQYAFELELLTDKILQDAILKRVPSTPSQSVGAISGNQNHGGVLALAASSEAPQLDPAFVRHPRR